MEFKIDGAVAPYVIRRPEDIATPRLLVFQDRVEFNIQRMQQLLRAANPELDVHNLWPHVKTTKSTWATQVLMQHGISFFKATMNEVDMLAQSGAEHIFVAYPLLAHDAQRLARLADAHPEITFYIQIGCPEHLEILRNALKEFETLWRYFLDVNVGMDRTGMPVEQAFSLYRLAAGLDGLEFAGLHAYDGHIHQTSVEARRQTAQASMARLRKALKQFSDNGVKVPMTIVGGTPGFLLDAEILRQATLQTQVFYSPGTWVYFDSQSREMLPGTFELAALILAQVIDRPTPSTATLNLGHKRWAVDQGPVELFSVSGMVAESWSEEHTVVAVPQHVEPAIGDYILVAPRHVCPTVNLWEHFVVVNANGEVEDVAVPVDARNR